MRPRFPNEWEVPNDPKLWITWAHVDSKLRGETVYWISTASSRGKPHAAPVWGIWKSDGFYFETGPGSVKGRNLKENPRAVVHVQDGSDTVIVEGDAERVTDHSELSGLLKDYARKYDYRPDWSSKDAQAVFRVLPRIVHAWRTPKMHANLVNFNFREARGRHR